MSEEEEFTIHVRDNGDYEVRRPDGSRVAILGSREEAELVATTPELTRNCMEEKDRSLPFAYHLEYVLSLYESHSPAWRWMHSTAEDIKRTIKPKRPVFEKWRAMLYRPRVVPLRPFRTPTDVLATSPPDPLPELHTLTDSEIEVLQRRFPDFRPGRDLPHDLQAILMHDMDRPATELPDLTVPLIVGLLKRAEEVRTQSAITTREPKSGDTSAEQSSHLPSMGTPADVNPQDKALPISQERTAESIPGEVATDRFEIVEKVKMGASGEVYRAKDLRIQRDVALKFLLGGKDPTGQILQEARVVAKADHGNVVTIYDVVDIWHPDAKEDSPCLVMEFVNGQDLNERSKLTIEELRAMAEAVIDVLKYMHSKGMVHGDLHAGNVILSKEGETKVIDVLRYQPSASLSTASLEQRQEQDLHDFVGILIKASKRSDLDPERTRACLAVLYDAPSLSALREKFLPLLEGAGVKSKPRVPIDPAGFDPDQQGIRCRQCGGKGTATLPHEVDHVRRVLKVDYSCSGGHDWKEDFPLR